MGGRQSQPAEEQPPSLDILDAGARLNQLAQEARGFRWLPEDSGVPVSDSLYLCISQAAFTRVSTVTAWQPSARAMLSLCESSLML